MVKFQKKYQKKNNYDVFNLSEFIEGYSEDDEYEFSDLYKLIRCPYAWYSNIDWDSNQVKVKKGLRTVK